MTIAPAITTALTSLENQVTAASPLAQASAPTILALQLNAQALTGQIEQAQYDAAGQLDTWTDTSQAPEMMIQGVVNAYNSANDESSLAELRGIVGRVTSNLDQLL
jgi:hypothetical protein